jgi:hypothetical protein
MASPFPKFLSGKSRPGGASELTPDLFLEIETYHNPVNFKQQKASTGHLLASSILISYR